MAVKSYGAAAAAPQDLVTKAELDAAIAGVSGGSGMPGSVSSTAPGSPTTNYLWVDTSEPGVLELTDFGTGNPTTPTGALKAWARTRAGRRMLAMMGPSGLDTSLQPFMGTNQVRMYMPVNASTTLTVLGDGALTATGTATAASVTAQTTASSANLHLGTKRIDYLAASASNAVAGFRQATGASNFYVSSAAGMGGFFYICRFSPATGGTVSTRRLFVGVGNSTAAPTDVEPSSLTNIIGVGYNAADANWQILTGGTTAGNKVSTGIARPSTDRPGIYECAIYCPPGSLSPTVQFTDLFTGQSFSQQITAGVNVPASGTALSARGYSSIGTTTASVTGITLFGMYIETDF